MTRDEVLRRLWTARAEFDRLVSEIPVGRLSEHYPMHYSHLQEANRA
jgi:hypothetical protein